MVGGDPFSVIYIDRTCETILCVSTRRHKFVFATTEPDKRAARQRLMNASPFDPRCDACAQLARLDELQAWWKGLDEVDSRPVSFRVQELESEAWKARPRPDDVPGCVA